MFGHLSSSISEPPRGQEGPWRRVSRSPAAICSEKSARFSVTAVYCSLCEGGKKTNLGAVALFARSWCSCVSPCCRCSISHRDPPPHPRFEVKQRMMVMNVANAVRGALNGGAYLFSAPTSILRLPAVRHQSVQLRNVCDSE